MGQPVAAPATPAIIATWYRVATRPVARSSHPPRGRATIARPNAVDDGTRRAAH